MNHYCLEGLSHDGEYGDCGCTCSPCESHSLRERLRKAEKDRQEIVDRPDPYYLMRLTQEKERAKQLVGRRKK